MSSRDRLPSVNIQPGAIVSTQDFNISTAGSLEDNIDGELTRRSEHQIVDFVVTISTFYDSDFEGGYTAADALSVDRNTSDTTKIDIKPGVGYIGGRRYKQISTLEAYDLTGSTDDLYYIRLRYRTSTQTFDFIAETSESADSSTTKYLTLASATWDTTPGEWLDDFSDLRATNTQLPVPSTISGSSTSPILTVQQDGTGDSLKVVGNASGGDVTFFDTTNPRVVSIYGTNTDALTIVEDGSSYSVKLVADNTDRLKVLNNLYVPTNTQLGSMTFSTTTFSGCVTFDCGASPSFTTSSGDFAWNSENFTGIGSIGCASVDATGNIQGSVLISDIITGTAPLTVTSTTKVANLNVEQVDGYDLNQAVQTTSSPTFSSLTLGVSGVTFDSSGTDPVISAKSTGGELYFGDTITIADKETSPDWNVTGAGVATFSRIVSSIATGTAPVSVTSTTVCTNLNADLWDGNQFSDYINQAVKTTSSPTFTQVSVTNGPTVSATGIAGATGDDITGFDNISATSLTLSGAISGDTATDTINGVVISAGVVTTGTWQGTDIAAGYLGAHDHTSASQGGDYPWADITGLASVEPGAVDFNAGAAGTSTVVARQDHNHDLVAHLHTTLGNMTADINMNGQNLDNLDYALGGASFVCSYIKFDTSTSAELQLVCGDASNGFDFREVHSNATTDPLFHIAVDGDVTLYGDINSSGGIEMDGYLRLSGGGGASGTDGYATIGEYADGIQIYEPTAGSQSGSAFRIYTTTSPDGWVIGTSTGDDIYISENLYPDGTVNIGSSSVHHNYIYANYIRYDVDSQSFDHVDDLAIIDALGPRRDGKRNENGVPMMDNSVLPPGVRDEDGMIDAQNYSNFLAGAMKQLHRKMKDQGELIGALMDKIDLLEARINGQTDAG